MILHFGINEVPINVDEFLIHCPSCEKHSWADILVISKYFQIYLLPFLPTDKEANVQCKTCGLKRNGIPFNHKLISNYEEVKNQFSHSWKLYIGFALLLVIIISLIIAANV
jgi:hypothetical protein